MRDKYPTLRNSRFRLYQRVQNNSRLEIFPKTNSKMGGGGWVKMVKEPDIVRVIDCPSFREPTSCLTQQKIREP